jgi:tetratricopeptide (TPR) repeat protein
VQQKYKDAEDLYKQALYVEQHAINFDADRMAATENRLGALFKDQGRYEDAEPFLRSSVSHAEKSGNTQTLIVALNNLALLLREEGKPRSLVVFCMTSVFSPPDPESINNTLALADVGLRSHDISIFSAAFQSASPQARDAFFAAGGNSKIDAAFSGDDRAHAHAYASRGEADLATLINGSHHWYHTSNELIDQLVSTASDTDRLLYARGKALGEAQNLAPADQTAVDFYKGVRAALQSAGGTEQADKWEAKLLRTAAPDSTAEPPVGKDAASFHAFVDGSSHASPAQLARVLESMTPKEKQDLANDYFARCHTLITTDVIGKVPEADKFRFRELLSTGEINGRQMALDAAYENGRHNSVFDGFMDATWDKSQRAATESVNKIDAFVQQHAAEINNLPPEQRKQLTDALANYSQAVDIYIRSKGEMAETLVDAAITVGAIGGAVLSGGASLSLLALVGAGAAGAAAKVGGKSLIEGSDYTSAEMPKDAFMGFTTSALSFAPGMAGLGRAAAGAEAQGFRAIAARELADYGRNVAVASGANAFTEVAATAAGFEDPNTLVERTEHAAIAGAAFGTVFHVGFRAVGATAEFVRGRGRGAAEDVRVNVEEPVVRAREAGAEVPDPIGRPLTPERVAEIEAKFPKLEDVPGRDDLTFGKELAVEDLRRAVFNPNILDAQGKPMTVYKMLEEAVAQGKLEQSDADMLLEARARVREKHARIKSGDNEVWPDQFTNEMHEEQELGYALYLGMKENASRSDLFEAAMAGIYTDADKAARFTPGEEMGNFTVHHLRGADVARHHLQELGMPEDRIRRIVVAIETHQETPRDLMALLNQFPAGGKLNALKAQAEAGTFPMERYEQLKQAFDEMTEPAFPGAPPFLRKFKAIAEANDSPIGKLRDEQGRWYLDLNDDQREILSWAGLPDGRWYVSVNPDHPDFARLPEGDPRRFKSEAELEEARRQFRINEIVKGADANENYLWDIGKFLDIRGAHTDFPDGVIDDSIDSVLGNSNPARRQQKGSWGDALDSLHGAARELLQNGKESVLAAINDPQTGLYKHLDDFMAAHPDFDGLYYTRKVVHEKPLTADEMTRLKALQQQYNVPPLDYSPRLTVEQRVHNIEEWVHNLPEEVKALQYQNRPLPDGTRVEGRLTDEQIIDLEKSIIVRDEAASWFRRLLTADGSVPDRSQFRTIAEERALRGR